MPPEMIIDLGDVLKSVHNSSCVSGSYHTLFDAMISGQSLTCKSADLDEALPDPWFACACVAREELTYEMLILEPRASDEETPESEVSIGMADSSENITMETKGAISDPSGVCLFCNPACCRKMKATWKECSRLSKELYWKDWTIKCACNKVNKRENRTN